MSRWFRFYAEALNDPKVQKLDGDTFKGWVNLLCIASQNEGKLPALADVAFALRVDDNAARTLVERLSNATLIDRLNGGVNGVTHAMHGWDKRQYKSDTSNERVKRYRQRSKSVTETAPETEAETDNTVPKGTGADAPFDPTKLMFDSGVALIVQAGKSEAQARAWLGKAKRDFGEEAVIAAISRAKREGAIEPIAFMQGCLRHKSRVEEEYTGP